MATLEGLAVYGCFNFIGIFIGIPFLVMGTWLKHQQISSCEPLLSNPFITLGILIIIFCFLGVCCSCNIGAVQMIGCHEVIMLVLCCTLLVYSIFALAVSSAGSGVAVQGASYDDYYLDEYSHWLQKRVNNTKHWDHYKTCISLEKVCSSFRDEYGKDTDQQFFSRRLSSIQSGCCKPPRECLFNYTSPTEWAKPKDRVYSNMDCHSWNNDPNVLCFDCQSCKAGFADDLKTHWLTAGIVTFIFATLITVISAMGCMIVEDAPTPCDYWCLCLRDRKGFWT